MRIDAKSAEASLADIDVIVARLKQSSFYRGASTLLMIWGALIAIGYVANWFFPRNAGVIWIVINGMGLIATVAAGWRYRRTGTEFDWRIVIAIVLFFALGLACCWMGHFGPRELNAFWPILFMFGYALAGLWLGRVFTLLGVVIAALTFVGYLSIERWFELYLAVVDGGGLILAGLWMRRA
jgi:hypothetical protein